MVRRPLKEHIRQVVRPWYILDTRAAYASPDSDPPFTFWIVLAGAFMAIRLLIGGLVGLAVFILSWFIPLDPYLFVAHVGGRVLEAGLDFARAASSVVSAVISLSLRLFLLLPSILVAILGFSAFLGLVFAVPMTESALDEGSRIIGAIANTLIDAFEPYSPQYRLWADYSNRYAFIAHTLFASRPINSGSVALLKARIMAFTRVATSCFYSAADLVLDPDNADPQGLPVCIIESASLLLELVSSATRVVLYTALSATGLGQYAGEILNAASEVLELIGRVVELLLSVVDTIWPALEGILSVVTTVVGLLDDLVDFDLSAKLPVPLPKFSFKVGSFGRIRISLPSTATSLRIPLFPSQVRRVLRVPLETTKTVRRALLRVDANRAQTVLRKAVEATFTVAKRAIAEFLAVLAPEEPIVDLSQLTPDAAEFASGLFGSLKRRGGGTPTPRPKLSHRAERIAARAGWHVVPPPARPDPGDTRGWGLGMPPIVLPEPGISIADQAKAEGMAATAGGIGKSRNVRVVVSATADSVADAYRAMAPRAIEFAVRQWMIAADDLSSGGNISVLESARDRARSHGALWASDVYLQRCQAPTPRQYAEAFPATISFDGIGRVTLRDPLSGVPLGNVSQEESKVLQEVLATRLYGMSSDGSGRLGLCEPILTAPPGARVRNTRGMSTKARDTLSFELEVGPTISGLLEALLGDSWTGLRVEPSHGSAVDVGPPLPRRYGGAIGNISAADATRFIEAITLRDPTLSREAVAQVVDGFLVAIAPSSLSEYVLRLTAVKEIVLFFHDIIQSTRLRSPDLLSCGYSPLDPDSVFTTACILLWTAPTEPAPVALAKRLADITSAGITSPVPPPSSCFPGLGIVGIADHAVYALARYAPEVRDALSTLLASIHEPAAEFLHAWDDRLGYEPQNLWCLLLATPTIPVLGPILLMAGIVVDAGILSSVLDLLIVPVWAMRPMPPAVRFAYQGHIARRWNT